MSAVSIRRACAVLVALAAIALIPVAAAGARPAPSPAPTYLALGDSLAYGYHQALFYSELPSVDPSTFDHGYVDDFGGLLRLFQPGLKIVNDGCPGETSDTMINGSGVTGYCAGGPTGTPFPYVWLHHPYTASSQLADALQILHTTPGVDTITLDIGANDLLQFLHATCGFPAGFSCSPTQIGAEIAHIGQNTASILGQLRAAAGPRARIVLMGLYNAYPAILPPPGGDTVVSALNATFKQVAASVPNTGFADPEPVFNPSTVTGGPETQDVPAICLLTAMCPGGTYSPSSPSADIHPTNLGYGVLGALVGLAYVRR